MISNLFALAQAEIKSGNRDIYSFTNVATVNVSTNTVLKLLVKSTNQTWVVKGGLPIRMPS
jgi:hypothetical protein